jgi:hypothetical protein
MILLIEPIPLEIAMLNTKTEIRPKNNKKNYSGILFALLFLLIFGPRLFGSDLLDIISIVSFGLAALFVVNKKVRSNSARLGGFPILLFYLALIYSIIIVITSTHPEFYHPLRFLRIVINYLAAYALCGLYFHHFEKNFIDHLMEHIFWAIALHGLILIIQYINPDFRQFLYNVSGNPNEKVTRVTGLTISYGILSVVQGFGIVVAIFLRRDSWAHWKKLFFIPAFTIIVISLLLSGRSGLYLMTVVTVIAILIHFRQTIQNPKFFLLLAGVIFLLILTPRLIPNGVVYRFRTRTQPHILEPITSYQERGTFISGSVETVLTKMYFLPEDFRTLVFGSSISGRDSIYIPSDVGYVLQIYGLGIIGTMIIIMFYIYSFFVAWRWWPNNRAIAYLLFSLTCALLILNAKEQALLTRHAFTLSSLLITSWYFYRDESHLKSDIKYLIPVIR